MSQVVETLTDGRESTAGSQPTLQLFLLSSLSPQRCSAPSTVVQVAQFLKKGEIPELEIGSKQAAIPSLQPLSYFTGMNCSLLKNLYCMGKFDDLAPNASTVEDLFEEVIENFIDAIVQWKDSDAIDRAAIEKVFIGFEMPMSILDPDARNKTPFSDVFERAESFGAGCF